MSARRLTTEEVTLMREALDLRAATLRSVAGRSRKAFERGIVYRRAAILEQLASDLIVADVVLR